MQEPWAWYAVAAEILESVSERWALAGALAAGRYRLAERGTADVDILASWHEQLIPAFEDAGYEIRESEDPGEPHPHLLRLRRGTERIDIIVSNVEYQEVALDRAQDHILTIEDVLIHKLIAWRPRDRDDIGSILLAEHDLDLEYLAHWVKEWELEERWREATSAR